MKLLCWLGLHNWQHGYKPVVNWQTLRYKYKKARMCKACGIIEIREKD